MGRPPTGQAPGGSIQGQDSVHATAITPPGEEGLDARDGTGRKPIPSPRRPARHDDHDHDYRETIRR